MSEAAIPGRAPTAEHDTDCGEEKICRFEGDKKTLGERKKRFHFSYSEKPAQAMRSPAMHIMGMARA
ncbi:hypothetical protein [Sinorhizobium meliloti]|uniref:hypothetical protein n=1 Tax=Rhizobium meliloti TaxID=382 RepID=UPI000FD760A2|nr:hypothetical protein [Sinorhizobium meliloti]RVE82146.1 hypothetical protein CN238_28735 [Sinorhizobium meliloti]RVH24043.1 hypothetical protein CN214_26390 [Sinorhizobium meliloti]